MENHGREVFWVSSGSDVYHYCSRISSQNSVIQLHQNVRSNWSESVTLDVCITQFLEDFLILYYILHFHGRQYSTVVQSMSLELKSLGFVSWLQCLKHRCHLG